MQFFLQIFFFQWPAHSGDRRRRFCTKS